ncbi:MAG: GcrA family cell cycle regulator [Pseudomonadota bacterium]
MAAMGRVMAYDEARGGRRDTQIRWTDDLVSTLREAAGAGHSARQISDILSERHGVSVSRCAVIGQCRRRGIAVGRSQNPDLARSRIKARRTSAKRKSVKKAGSQTTSKGPVAAPDPVAFDDLQPRQCLWALSINIDPNIPISEERFCGAPVVSGRPYCAAHNKAAASESRISDKQFEMAAMAAARGVRVGRGLRVWDRPRKVGK